MHVTFSTAVDPTNFDVNLTTSSGGQEQCAFQDVSEMGAALISIFITNFPIRKLITKRILKTLHAYLWSIKYVFIYYKNAP